MELLGADKCMLVLPVAGHVNIEAVNYAGSVDAYPQMTEELDRRIGFWRRHMGKPVYTRKTIWRGVEPQYYKSAYYHECVVPHRCFDAVGMTVELAPVPGPTALAKMLLHHESETGPKFGRRGVTLLRLLQPAFAAGVRARLASQAAGAKLGALVDDLSQPVLLLDPASRNLVHVNRALNDLLASDPDRDAALARLQALGTALLQQMRSPPGSLEARIETGGASWTASCSLVDAGLFGSTTLAMITLKCDVRPRLAHGEIVRRFGLTRKQAVVASLIADGLSNHEIAGRLSISPHTARHHVEGVLAKLGARRRGQVAVILQGPRNEV
jgi:DNA-binding CsgD family transcriptional regulator